MGQPDIQQAFNTVSVEGFDQIYQPDAVHAEAGPEPAQSDPTLQAQTALDQQVQPDPTEGVSLEDAAKVLGLHMDTVRKRLQKGKIKGFKVADKFGEKWLVHKDELTKNRLFPPQQTPAAQAAPDVVQARPTVEVQPDPIDQVVEIELGPEPVQPRPAPSIQTDPEHARLMSIIESQAHQLKAAGDVIMYLRNEVEDAKTQVKLLTDSQHKSESKWWHRFCTWFLSGKPRP